MTQLISFLYIFTIILHVTQFKKYIFGLIYEKKIKNVAKRHFTPIPMTSLNTTFVHK